MDAQPKQLESQTSRLALTAAYLLAYWADKGMIPRYEGVIDGLRESAKMPHHHANAERQGERCKNATKSIS